MSSKLGQGFISFYTELIININTSIQKHEIYKLQSIWVSLGLSQNRGLPCIYDSLLLIRPECSFREGIRIQNKLTSKRRFYEELNKEESLVHGIMACNKLAYTKLKTSERMRISDEILANSRAETAIGLASALVLVKAYANWLLVEVNQICYGGIVRTIALGFTEGISSWKVESLCTFQPLVVPVGRSTLGRLFNVLGATIDAYSGIDELPIYSEYPVSFDQHKNQKVQFKRMGYKRIKIHISEFQISDFPSAQKSVRAILTALDKNLSQSKTNSIYIIQLKNLRFIYITKTKIEIIKTKKLKAVSFSNVLSISAQRRIKFNIIGLIEGGAKLI